MATKSYTIKTKNLKPGKILHKRTTKKLEKNPETDNVNILKNPDVIVDFEYNEGLISIVIENIGDDSAYNTSVKFNKKILGMQKTKNISSLKIFQALTFLPPGKKIKMLIDVFEFYLIGKQPLQINTIISFSNKLKQTFQNSIQHDLSIYQDIVDICYVKKNN